MALSRTWKIVGASAVAVGVVAGTALAVDRIELNDSSDPIELNTTADEGTNGTEGPGGGDVDLSPESADSPFESAEDSPDSPFDSPDDPGFDPSPESPDSPFESAVDSPGSAASPD